MIPESTDQEHEPDSNLDYLEEAVQALEPSPVEMLVLTNQMVGMLAASADPHLWRGAVDRAVLNIHENRGRPH